MADSIELNPSNESKVKPILKCRVVDSMYEIFVETEEYEYVLVQISYNGVRVFPGSKTAVQDMGFDISMLSFDLEGSFIVNKGTDLVEETLAQQEIDISGSEPDMVEDDEV